MKKLKMCSKGIKGIRRAAAELIPKSFMNLERTLRKKSILKRYGFSVQWTNGMMVVLKDGYEVYVKDKVVAPYDDTYILTIVHHLRQLNKNNFQISFGRNSMTLSKDNKSIYVEAVDKHLYLESFINALASHWDSIRTDVDGNIVAIAGVLLNKDVARVFYNNTWLEYEISKEWMYDSLEEVLFFPEILLNYLDGVRMKQGDVVFDLGGYHGLFSLAASVDTGSNGRVFCFEPDLDNSEVTRRNVEHNGLNNIEIVPMVVSGRCGRRRFVMSSSFSSKIADSRNGIESEDGIEVESTTLQGFCNIRSISKPDFVKADIEGAEIEMIEGNLEWIADNDITFSVASYHIVDGKPTWCALEKIFHNIGYKVRTSPPGTHRTTIAKRIEA
jgi:FkbM family methyltransferase